jgi:GINS complex subunit 2
LIFFFIFSAPDDIPNSQKIRTVLEDLWTKRYAKMKESLLAIDPNTVGIKLTNLSAMEINSIRPALIQAQNQFYALHRSMNTESLQQHL